MPVIGRTITKVWWISELEEESEEDEPPRPPPPARDMRVGGERKKDAWG